jgi:hypothetical protein
MTVGMTENGYGVSLLEIKVTKGNELTDLITETMDGSDFAKNEYNVPIAAGAYAVKKKGGIEGWEAGKEVRVSKQIAMLGARGDYAEFKLHCSQLGTATIAMTVDMFKVQALDYSGVPVAVQHSIFGKFSPFLTPTQPVTRGMIRGVDKQEIELANNVVLATAETTAVNQKVRGTATSKVTWVGDNDTPASMTYFKLKVTPGSDQVYVIPRGAKIWAGNSSAATLTYVAT